MQKVRTACALAVVVALATVAVLQSATKQDQRAILLERSSKPRLLKTQHQAVKQSKDILDEIVRKELELQQIETMENTIKRGLSSSPAPKLRVPVRKAWSNPHRPRIVVWRIAHFLLPNPP